MNYTGSYVSEQEGPESLSGDEKESYFGTEEGVDFLALEAGARLVLTDSGGVQEETTVLGVPCITLRESTERPITVTEGTNTVVGRDRERILDAARRALNGDVVARRPELWDGRAGERIAEVLLAGGTPAGRPRPTDNR